MILRFPLPKSFFAVLTSSPLFSQFHSHSSTTPTTTTVTRVQRHLEATSKLLVDIFLASAHQNAFFRLTRSIDERIQASTRRPQDQPSSRQDPRWRIETSFETYGFTTWTTEASAASTTTFLDCDCNPARLCRFGTCHLFRVSVLRRSGSRFI